MSNSQNPKESQGVISHRLNLWMIAFGVLVLTLSILFDLGVIMSPNNNGTLFSVRSGNVLIILGFVASIREYNSGSESNTISDTFDKVLLEVPAETNSSQNRYFYTAIVLSIIGTLFAGFGDYIVCLLTMIIEFILG